MRTVLGLFAVISSLVVFLNTTCSFVWILASPKSALKTSYFSWELLNWCNLTRDYSIDTLYKLSITILTVKFASYHLLSLLHCWSSLINNNLRFLIVKETADVITDAIFRKRLKLHNGLCSFNISLVEFDPLWWWVLMDSNHRPLRYQHSALTNWAKDPFFAQSIRLLHSVVEDDGIEPTTPCLQSRCSPSWANPPLNSALLCRSFACIVYYASLFAAYCLFIQLASLLL